MGPSKIEWCDYQWNPITGCLGECPYCASRKKSKRFTGDKRMNLKLGDYRKDGEMYILDSKFVSESGGTLNYPFGFAPTYHRYRFDVLERWKQTRNILVGGDGDMFGPWVPDEYINEVFDNCNKYQNHHYLFLTAYPQRYRDLSVPADERYWYGTSITREEEMKRLNYLPKNAHKFVCFEPLQEDVLPKKNKLVKELDWVIIGAETGNRRSRVEPMFEWIKDLVVECDYAAIPVFMEDSLIGIVPKQSMRKDYPKYLTEIEVGEVLRERLYGKCMMCNEEERKSNMITLLARSMRGEQPKQFGFMCKKCYTDFCKSHNVEIPPLKNMDK